MPQATAQVPDVEEGLSAECALAKRPGYQGLHRECRQTRDVPLPHVRGILLVTRCRCICHRRSAS